MSEVNPPRHQKPRRPHHRGFGDHRLVRVKAPPRRDLQQAGRMGEAEALLRSRGMVMGQIRVLEKQGGKSGDWVAA